MIDDVAPKQVWAALLANPNARLVDVRTDYEWSRIGVPDLTEAGKQPALVSWQLAPAMQVNGAFLDQLAAAGLRQDDDLYFLCRSGVRSLAAAQAAAAAGYAHVHNVADGFEGPPDGQGMRGTQAGWQADGLPWAK